MLVTLTKKFGKIISSKIALDKNLNEYICPNFLLISTFNLHYSYNFSVFDFCIIHVAYS